MNESATLESIGKFCGVSHTTVSRALRGHGNVKEATARRIREYAETIGYKPNPIARSLARSGNGEFLLSSTKSIIVPYNDITMTKHNPLFWDYVQGAVRVATQRESSIEVIGFKSGNAEFDFIRALVESKRIAGILDLGLQPATIDYLLSKKIPIVSRLQSVHKIHSRKNACVYPDHIQGYVMGWHYLQSQGHTRMGFIGNTEHLPRLHECTAASHLVPEQPKLETVLWVDPTADSPTIQSCLTAQLGPWNRKSWPSVFFCSNDDVAQRVVVALNEMGLLVPRDVSIFGFDDSPASEFCNPPITTLRNPRMEIGKAMFALLQEIIAGRPESQERIHILPMQLVVRKSISVLK